MGTRSIVTRRRFLIVMGIAGSAGVLAACQAAPSAPSKPAESKTAEAAKPAESKPAVAATTAPAKPAEAAKPADKPAAAAPAAGSSSQVLQVVLSAEATQMEPVIDTIKSSLVITNTMIEPLVMNTPDLKYAPWLAESWSPVSPTKWRVKLKQGVKFHNGEPFNADSVVYSIGQYLTTKGIARSWYDWYAPAEKVDEYTVDIVTKDQAGILPASLAYIYAFPPKYHAELGPEGFGHKPVGTGPWKFVEWKPGVNLNVEPNPDYWGKKPAIGEIRFRWAPDSSARVALLETGEVHLAQNIPPALVDRVERSGQARIEAIKSARKVFLMININDGPFKDVRVRRAVNMAIDVEGIIKTLFRGRAYGRDRGVSVEGFEGYQFDQLPPITYDPEGAKKLLAEAGFGSGFETTLWHPIGRYMLDKESSEAMASQLEKVGIKVALQGMESGAFFSKVSAERLPGLVFYACGPLWMTPVWCAQIHFMGASGIGYAADPTTEKLIAEARSATEDAKRAPAYQAMEKYIYTENVGWVWLWHQQDIYGASNKLDWKPRSDELIAFDLASFK